MLRACSPQARERRRRMYVKKRRRGLSTAAAFTLPEPTEHTRLRRFLMGFGSAPQRLRFRTSTTSAFVKGTGKASSGATQCATM